MIAPAFISPTDTDWYTWSMTQGDRLTCGVKHWDHSCPVLELYSDDCTTMLALADNCDENPTTLADFVVPYTGEYHLKVRMFGTATNIYRLFVAMTPPPGPISACTGTVYDITGSPLPGVLVAMNAWVDTTDEAGHYTLGDTEGKQNRNQMTSRLRSATEYLPDFLYFEKQSKWSAHHDMRALSGSVSFNAVLPDSVGPRYGELTLPEEFMYIWDVIYEWQYQQLNTYRSIDLPIPVDGKREREVNGHFYYSDLLPADWTLVQQSIDRLNAGVGETMFVLSPGHGYPSSDSVKTGIMMIYNTTSSYNTSHVSQMSLCWNGANMDGAFLLGGAFIIRTEDWGDPSVMDHEWHFHLYNDNTWNLQRLYAGIFRHPSLPMNHFNNEHHYLVRQLAKREEEGKNNLTIFDYVRYYWEEQPTTPGACCSGEGGCSMVPRAQCESGGGVWQGVGTDCDPNPCVPAGISDQTTVPELLGLGDPKPNPSAQSTSISYEVPSSGQAAMVIFDVAGRVVRTLVNRDHVPGTYVVDWDGKDGNGRSVAGGIYFYELKAGGVRLAKRVIVLR
jgi:hypothetical protein